MNGKPLLGKKIWAGVLFCAFFLFSPGALVAQAGIPAAGAPQSAAPASRLQLGVSLYGRGMWPEALAELRRAYLEGGEPSRKAEALYWIAMTELAAAHYEESIRAMDELQRLSPGNTRYAEVPYHRGRVYYYLGRYDEAIVLFRTFIDSIAVDVPGENARKPAALYWMGECLFSLGQLDRAQDIFSLIVEQYPQSVKYEASSYRLALINQKKIEAELLAIIKWSHEESLRTVEAYQRRERSYDQAIIAYQRRIADLLHDDRLARLELAAADLRRQAADAEARAADAEGRLAGAEEYAARLESLLEGMEGVDIPEAPVSAPAPLRPSPGTGPGGASPPAPSGGAPDAPALPPEILPPSPAPIRSPLNSGDAAPQVPPGGSPVSSAPHGRDASNGVDDSYGGVASNGVDDSPEAVASAGTDAAPLPPASGVAGTPVPQAAPGPAVSGGAALGGADPSPFSVAAQGSAEAGRLRNIRSSAQDLIDALDSEISGGADGGPW